MTKSKRLIRELSQFVNRVGFAKAANRFGRTEQTVRKWLKDGIPEQHEKAAKRIIKRSERASEAGQEAAAKRKMGLTVVKNFSYVDQLIGADAGYTKARMESRRKYKAYIGESIAPIRQIYKDASGALYYYDTDGITWRAYTVWNEDRTDWDLYWTQSINIAGYDSAKDFTDMYESLRQNEVNITF